MHQLALLDLLLRDLELKEALLLADRDRLEVPVEEAVSQDGDAVDFSMPVITDPSAAAALNRNLGTANSYSTHSGVDASDDFGDGGDVLVDEGEAFGA